LINLSSQGVFGYRSKPVVLKVVDIDLQGSI